MIRTVILFWPKQNSLCYAMLCYAMLCYAMLCYAMLCYAMLCYGYVFCIINSKMNNIAYGV